MKGRVTLDVPDSASIEDLFRAISSTDLFIGPGPLRRVSTSSGDGGQSAVGSVPGGEPVNVSLRHVHLSTVLCILREVSGREIRMPAKSQRRLSFFATEMPVGVALDRLVPGSSTDAVNACEIPTASSGSRLSTPLRFEQLGIGDLRVAGLAHVGEAWKAYVYTPGGRAMAIEEAEWEPSGAVTSGVLRTPLVNVH